MCGGLRMCQEGRVKETSGDEIREAERSIEWEVGWEAFGRSCHWHR